MERTRRVWPASAERNWGGVWDRGWTGWLAECQLKTRTPPPRAGRAGTKQKKAPPIPSLPTPPCFAWSGDPSLSERPRSALCGKRSLQTTMHFKKLSISLFLSLSLSLILLFLCGCMGEWMNGWIYGWMHGWMDVTRYSVTKLPVGLCFLGCFF